MDKEHIQPTFPVEFQMLLGYGGGLFFKYEPTVSFW